MAEDWVWHSFYSATNSVPRLWPFRHLVLENFLHPALYASLAAADFSDSIARRHHPTGRQPSEQLRFAVRVDAATDLSALPDPALAAVWQTLTDARLTKVLPRIFAQEIAKRHGPDPIPSVCTMEVIEDRTGYALLPHVDVRKKLVTVLIYLADPAAGEHLGTAIYVPNKSADSPKTFQDNERLPREHFAIAATIPYRANTALIFAPGNNTFHGVEAVPEGTRRRLLQFQINHEGMTKGLGAA